MIAFLPLPLVIYLLVQVVGRAALLDACLIHPRTKGSTSKGLLTSTLGTVDILILIVMATPNHRFQQLAYLVTI